MYYTSYSFSIYIYVNDETTQENYNQISINVLNLSSQEVFYFIVLVQDLCIVV